MNLSKGAVVQSARMWYEKTYPFVFASVRDKREAEAVTKGLLSHYLGYSVTKHVCGAFLIADMRTQKLLEMAQERVAAQEPLQYIIGKAFFYNYFFQVNRHVLIPRRETEGLVHAILYDQQHHCAPKVLDLCTGSGCIGICLAKEKPEAIVHACDISLEALDVARKNADALGVKVDFFPMDILKDDLTKHSSWDIIVSNPPYLTEHDKKKMHQSVLAYEPSMALFVPEENPLIFYKRLALLAAKHLAPGGCLYVEINPLFSKRILQIFSKPRMQNISIHQDIHGVDRWIVAEGY